MSSLKFILKFLTLKAFPTFNEYKKKIIQVNILKTKESDLEYVGCRCQCYGLKKSDKDRTHWDNRSKKDQTYWGHQAEYYVYITREVRLRKVIEWDQYKASLKDRNNIDSWSNCTIEWMNWILPQARIQINHKVLNCHHRCWKPLTSSSMIHLPRIQETIFLLEGVSTGTHT